jgi:hypothetical protein
MLVRMTYLPAPQARAAARDRLLRRRRAFTSVLTVVTFGATGGVAGLLGKPVARRLPTAPAVTSAPASVPGAQKKAAARVVPKPRRTVYVRLPATRRAAPATTPRTAAARPRAATPVRPPVPAQAPPATTSSGS